MGHGKNRQNAIPSLTVVWKPEKNESIPFTHRIHGAAIYGNMDPINTPPVMLAYIPAPWIRHGLLYKQVQSMYELYPLVN